MRRGRRGGNPGGLLAPLLWRLGVAMPLLAALPVLQATPPGQGLAALEAQTQALAFRLRGPRPVPKALVILAIDADSLALDRLLAPGERDSVPLWRAMGAWPWPRALQAELAATALEGGAARVVFNVVQAQPSRFGPADDEAFVRRLAPWRDRVVLAAAVTRQGVPGAGQGSVQVQLSRPQASLAAAALPVPALTAVLQSPQGLAEAIPGQDWIDDELGAFAPPLPRPLAYTASAAPVPRQPVGIDFPGPSGTIPQVPAWQVLQQPAGLWRGRTVLIGATAPDLGDQQETPFGPQSGTEVQAAALASVLAGSGFRHLDPWPATGLLLAWATLVLLVLGRARQASDTATLALALGLGALVAGGGLWALAHLLLPVPALLLAALLGGGLRGGGQWRQESRERAYLHQVLARRISPALLRELLKNSGPLGTQLGGSRARCVVLFTDLVDFTPLSAQLEPAALFALLNRYFAAISGAVIEEQGLLDKFIGDALMAEFGVPRSRGDAVEALAAVRAALAMRERLVELNRELAAQGLPSLRQGIGLHVGEVIAGNLGSPQRLEFTVIGAAVNVASRLEGLTRRFPDHPILISGELLALLPPGVEVDPLGRHPLKGWPQPLEVFGLRGLGPAADAGPGLASS
ncbi:adenylate/guanylate cyclase domain-containing protein [Vulcanococcus limneticus Candia 3F8]|uniref:adenylate/guanylate cyclase domain-containing protein n=1 Tax=Vulcanococcus limneticus TaxID=2170428 RepID=UPI000B98C665|nr:adenylate/guanylate cyclase domain-containing protein [Vulcanococcus limneticus]MCP9792867.1 adenylate/guanylate cyclase domain-containing protein [Vulcanococcus limneticus MW73D5]MCP9894772.1 adenylate/guanylate cyclase domain-containing protein [Vulcanococcus limneticus Candia 3F8]MCP9898254.1 adenylate/guanylate cyclase domain-containing protein [Vulcanococcus limneticus Candia 3B3]